MQGEALFDADVLDFKKWTIQARMYYDVILATVLNTNTFKLDWDNCKNRNYVVICMGGLVTLLDVGIPL